MPFNRRAHNKKRPRLPGHVDTADQEETFLKVQDADPDPGSIGTAYLRLDAEKGK